MEPDVPVWRRYRARILIHVRRGLKSQPGQGVTGVNSVESHSSLDGGSLLEAFAADTGRKDDRHRPLTRGIVRQRVWGFGLRTARTLPLAEPPQ
jgi:hypothetical protein